MYPKKLALAVAATAAGTAVVSAQRPANMSICDYYTKALLNESTAENQYTVLTLVVNTAVIGNYTMPNVGISVAGILAPGKYNGTDVNLLPYFTGDLESSNRGNKGVSVNFLDGGGAEPLKKNKPANDESSHQYFLLTHLYQFFGSLLGCSKYGIGAFPAYSGQASMYEVHAFMDLNPYQVGYFIEQVGLAAASFGVTQEDATAVGMALNELFGYRCSPPATAIKAQGPQLQSICIDGACPLAMKDATCPKMAVSAPKNHTSGEVFVAPGGKGNGGSEGSASGTMTMASTMTTGTAAASGSMTSGSMTMTGTMATSNPTGVATAGAAAMGINVLAVAGALAAFAL